MCSEKQSGGIIHFNENTSFMASTLAHEIGHTFGQKHDYDWCKCKDAVCIMKNAIDDTQIPTLWSDCSIRKFNEVLKITGDQSVTSCIK